MPNSELSGLLDELWAEYVDVGGVMNRDYNERLTLYTHVADRVAALAAPDAELVVDPKARRWFMERLEHLRIAMGLTQQAGPYVSGTTVSAMSTQRTEAPPGTFDRSAGSSLAFGPSDLKTTARGLFRPLVDPDGAFGVKAIELYGEGFGLQLVGTTGAKQLRRDEVRVIDGAGFAFRLVAISLLQLPSVWHATALFEPRLTGFEELTISAQGRRLTMVLNQD